jgi:hypothetical protein
MAFALAKEILGEIRSKISTIPIPGGDLTLNGAELINESKSEQERLRAEIREYLESTTYQQIAIKEAEKMESIKKMMSDIPLGIYIGSFLFFFLSQ